MDNLEKLKNESEQKVKDGFNLKEFILYYLDNFAHRYFEETLEVNFKDNSYFIKGIERNLKPLLKSKNEDVKKRALDFYKNTSFKDRPYISLGYEVEVLEYEPDEFSGNILIKSSMNFNYPDFESHKTENIIVRSENLNFTDITVLRKDFIHMLEKVSGVFL